MSIYLCFQHHLQFTKTHYRTIADQKCPAPVDRNMKKNTKNGYNTNCEKLKFNW